MGYELSSPNGTWHRVEAVASNDHFLLVGDNQDNQGNGTIIIYRINENNFTFVEQLKGDSVLDKEGFGYGVAINADNVIVVLPSPNHMGPYIFRYNYSSTPMWKETNKLDLITRVDLGSSIGLTRTQLILGNNSNVVVYNVNQDGNVEWKQTINAEGYRKNSGNYLCFTNIPQNRILKAT